MSATASMRSGSGRLAYAVKPSASSFAQRVLEAERPGEHPAVELRQHHMHGEVGGPEPARVLGPGLAPRGGDHRLQHGRVRAVERRGLAVAGGERRGGDDDGRRQGLKRLAHEGAGFRILQAWHEERRGRQAAGGKRRAQRVDGRGVGGEQRGAVEDDGDQGQAGRDLVAQHMERHGPFARHVSPPCAGHVPALAHRACIRHAARGGEAALARSVDPLRGNNAAASASRQAKGSTPRTGAHRRGPRPATRRARCRTRGQAPTRPRRHSATSRARPEAAPR